MSSVTGVLWRFRDVRIGYPDFEIRAGFELGSGERIALLGRSGCGKSTLLKWIAGILDVKGIQSSGNILRAGEDIAMLLPESRLIGYVPQDQVLFTALDVLSNVTFGLRARGVGRKERERAGFDALERVGLKSRARSSVLELSGGERQRVALIRAVIWNPKLLLLDEPFSGLDLDQKRRFQEDLITWTKDTGVPVLWVTHESSEVESFATSRIELKEEGRVRYFER